MLIIKKKNAAYVYIIMSFDYNANLGWIYTMPVNVLSTQSTTIVIITNWKQIILGVEILYSIILFWSD